MEFFTVFITYFGRRLRSVWWQVALVTLMLWLPMDLATTFVDSVFYEQAEKWQYIVFKEVGDAVLDLIIWSYGLVLITLIMRESELIQRDFRQRGELAKEAHSPEPVREPGNFSTEAWDLWAPRWNPLALEALRLWPRLMYTRLLSGLALLVGALLLCVPALYLTVKLVVSDQVVVRDGVQGLGAINRSSELTQGRFWEVFLLQFLGFVLVVVVSVPVFGGLGAASYFYPFLDAPEYWFVMALAVMPVNVAVGFYGVFLYCIYNYLRWYQLTGGSLPNHDFLDYDPDAPLPPPPLPQPPPSLVKFPHPA